jgi:hypothetical protein
MQIDSDTWGVFGLIDSALMATAPVSFGLVLQPAPVTATNVGSVVLVACSGGRL